jgi:hypothetical protein
MAFRNQKATRAAMVMVLSLTSAPAAQSSLRYHVRHKHWLGSGAGVLQIDERAISYQELGKKKGEASEQLHHAMWNYDEIQQLYVSTKRLIILTYKDRKWLLGADEKYEFGLSDGQSFEPVYALLKDKLDRRLVAAIVDPDPGALWWEVPAKLLGRIQGSEGVLEAGAGRIIYKTQQVDQSRTWRYEDIENVSSTDPYHLTITAYERAVMHFGSMRDFNFQLKQPLDEVRFEMIWKRLNRSKGLQFLTSINERNRSRK